MMERRDVLIMSPACRSTRLQHLWVSPCLRRRTFLCSVCSGIKAGGAGGRRGAVLNQDTGESVSGGGGGTETELGYWR